MDSRSNKWATRPKKKRAAKTYEEIRDLVTQLSSAKNITERRKVGAKLRDDLAKHEIRRQLAVEATPDYVGPDDFSPAAQRCKALQRLWSSILTGTIGLAKTAIEKHKIPTKGKKPGTNAFQMDDVSLTHRLLVISGKKIDNDEYETSGRTIPLISEKIVREILDLYRKLLDDDKVQHEPSSEAEVLDMLDYLCSKPEYVGFFQHSGKRDFEKIFDQILDRLDPQVDVDTPGVFAASAKVLDTITQTCDQIGVQLEIYASEIIRLVADWCGMALNEPDRRYDVTHPAIVPLFNAVATTIKAHPEYCIGPMTRCGDFLFRYAQKAYPNVNKPSYKDALNRYFLSHIFVAQVAGKIQGALDGDLAGLGDATLSESRLRILLDHVIADTQHMMATSSYPTTHTTPFRAVKGSRRRGKKVIWNPLESRQQTHLDLIARLLAAAQRQHIARVSWDSVDNRSEMLEKTLKRPGPDKDGPWIDPGVQDEPQLSSDAIMQSPWMSLVMNGLFSDHASGTDKLIEHCNAWKSAGVLSIRSWLPGLASTVKKTPRRESLSTFLAIVGACSERFPGGECWALSVTMNWQVVKNESDPSEVISFHAPSSYDLAVILEALSVLLDMSGGVDGKQIDQYWILLVLTKLVKVTTTVRHFDSSGLREVSGAWRRIWETLFRSDLRYSNYTTTVGSNSIGEIIFILLTEMIRYDCLDAASSKSTRQRHKAEALFSQHDIWSMEVFSSNWNAQKRENPVVFELLLSVLHCQGLSQTRYEDDVENGGGGNAEESQKYRRKWLIRLGLHAFADALPLKDPIINQVTERLTSTIARCIHALVYGKTFLSSHCWSANDSRFALVGLYSQSSGRVSVQRRRDANEYTLTSCLERLWSEQSTAPPCPATSLRQIYEEHLDPAILVATAHQKNLLAYEATSMDESSDFVQQRDAEVLFGFCCDFLRSELNQHLEDDNGAEDDNNMETSQDDEKKDFVHQLPFCSKAMKEKLLFTLVAGSSQGMSEDDFFAKTSDVISFFQTTFSLLADTEIDPTLYYSISVELRKLASAFVDLHAVHPSKTLANTMTDVIKNCRKMVVRYGESVRCSSSEMINEIQVNKRDDRLSVEDDLFMDSDEEGLPSSQVTGVREYNPSPQTRKRGPGLGRVTQRKRRKTAGSLSSDASIHSVPPDLLCAREIAYMLVALDPSPKNCTLYCESLLGIDLEMHPEEIDGDIDLRSAMDCVGMLTSTPVLLNAYARRKLFGDEDEDSTDSILLTLFNTVEAIRDNSMSSSSLRLLGSFECIPAISKCVDAGLNLSIDVVESIAGLISDEANANPFNTSRPRWRVRRLDASMTAFHIGGPDFHTAFDKKYANAVRMGLQDRSLLVRKKAMIGAGVAIEQLEEAKIRETINKMTAPIRASLDDNEGAGVFEKWYKNVSRVVSQEHFNPSMQAEDSCTVLEIESIRAKLILASKTKSYPTFQALVFEICEISSKRPDLELVCYKSLEATALIRGYDGLAHLLECESNGFFASWVHNSSGATREDYLFPLFICGFEPFRKLMRFHRYELLRPDSQSVGTCDIGVGLREAAHENLLLRFQPLLLPLSLMVSSNTLPDTTDAQKMVDWLSNDPRMRIVLNIHSSDSEKDDQNITKVLKKFLLEILAFSSLLLCSGSPEDNAKGSVLQRVLFTLFTEETVTKAKAKGIRRFFRRVLDLSQSRSLSGMLPDDISVYELTLTKTIESLVRNNPKNQGATLSLVEQSIFSLRALEGCGEVPTWQDAVWVRFELLGRLAMLAKSNNSQAGFFLHTLTEIASRFRVRMQTRVLALIENIIRQLEDDTLEMSQVIKRCLTATFCVLENLHGANYNRQNPNISYSVLVRSCPCSDSGPNPCTEEDTPLIHGKDELSCLQQSYSLILMLIENMSRFGLTSFSFSSTVASPLLSQVQLSELSSLGLEYNPERRTFSLTDRVVNPTTTPELDKCLEEIRSASQRMDIQSRNRLDERGIKHKLLQLEAMLRTTESNCPAHEAMYILVDICKSAYPLDIKFAATRCMGLFTSQSMIAMTKHTSQTLEEEEDSIDDVGQMLVLLLRSPVAITSLAAAGTLDVLLSTEVGSQLESLAPFATRSRSRSFYKSTLSSEEIENLKARCGVTSTHDLDWCWDTPLWQLEEHQGTIIADLTTSIILCCFQNEANVEKRSELSHIAKIRQFFWECQRMTSMSTELSTIVFPKLIVALVTECDRAEKNRAAISSAFQTLLASQHNEKGVTISRDSPTHKVRVLLLDTLDALRKHSQSAWIQNSDPKDRRAAVKRQGKKPQSTKGFRAVPYGAILHLGGLEVARACIESERWASALFYLDLYLEAQLGTAGAIFERISSSMSVDDIISNFKSTSDICGGMNSPVATADNKLVLPSTITAMSYNIKCYKALGEFDAVDTLQNLLASMSLTEELPGQESMVLEAETRGHRPSLGTLQTLSFQAGLTQQDQAINPLRVVESLDELGLQGFIKTYIDGVHKTHRSLLDTNDENELRDQWFKSSTENWAWDELMSRATNCEKDGDILDKKQSSIHRARSQSKNPGFFESLAVSLEGYLQNDVSGFHDSLFQARSSVVDMMSKIGEEHPTESSILQIVDRLKALDVVDNLCKGKENPPGPPSSISLEMSLFDFSWRLNEVAVVVETAKVSDASRRKPKKRKIENHLWQICETAIQERRPHVAEISLARLRSLLTLHVENGSDSKTPICLAQAEIAEARIMECRNDFKAATQRMAQISCFLSRNSGSNGGGTGISSTDHLLADAQLACGDWMTKYKTQPAKVVLRDYLEPGKELAIKLYDASPTITNANRAVAVSRQLGIVLSLLYDDLRSRVESKGWKEEEDRLNLMEGELVNIEGKRKSLSKVRMKKAEKDDKKKELTAYVTRITSEVGDKKKQRQEVEESIPFYLEKAIKSLLLSLKYAGTGCDSDLSSSVYLIISLWFGASENVSNESLIRINSCMMEETKQLNSFRFVPLTKQVFSRIDSDSDNAGSGFQKALHCLLCKMCNDHPYHCLPELTSIANGDVGMCSTSEEPDESSLTKMKMAGISKTDSAQQMMSKMRKDALGYVSKLVDSYWLLAEAYNALAYASIGKLEKAKQRSNIKFASVLSSSDPRLDSCLDKLPTMPTVLTSVPILRPGSDYGAGTSDPVGAERIKSFVKTFDFSATGRSRPKIVICIGTKGGRFKQLVKGNDDVRQDAIMSQVFLYVNSLMDRREDVENNMRLSERRRLKLLRYEVVPLSPKSGVIEFVNKTVSLGSFASKSHNAYFPDEWTTKKCRDHYDKLDEFRRGRNQPLDKLRKNLEEIFDNYSPTYRFFFIESFGYNAESWHNAKMNFTRSVAVSSIVGHILGIGDRHPGNILQLATTGEVLQIDFGMVFEQSKLLPVPECVPFRLTRDIVDGMGPCGTQGTFTNVAESTLKVLRDHSGELLTILSAILADPSFGWQLQQKNNPMMSFSSMPNPKSGNQSDEQTIDGEKRNSEAIKAISKVKEKLNGYEDSTSGEQQGVEGQVQLLINSARDVEKLAQHFGGWGPWQ